jgi:hypothetical protein
MAALTGEPFLHERKQSHSGYVRRNHLVGLGSGKYKLSPAPEILWKKHYTSGAAEQKGQGKGPTASMKRETTFGHVPTRLGKELCRLLLRMKLRRKLLNQRPDVWSRRTRHGRRRRFSAGSRKYGVAIAWISAVQASGLLAAAWMQPTTFGDQERRKSIFMPTEGRSKKLNLGQKEEHRQICSDDERQKQKLRMKLLRKVYFW